VKGNGYPLINSNKRVASPYSELNTTELVQLKNRISEIADELHGLQQNVVVPNIIK
jgi:hypothetical protein